MTFADMRPISLSNFVNKIFSRVIHERLVELLPNIILEEHAGFVKGRSIVENVLLTQEVITDIRLRTKAGPNVVIKLDMKKTYDRLSWLFLTKILRKMGFSEAFIGLIFNLIGNNWYFVLIIGQPNGFFKSSRGVKQGDPLSPTLFILAAEALSRGLNSLHTNLYFCGFGMPKWSPKINHLSYADDTIIFCSSDETSLRLVMEVLQAYESSSGQLVNKTKSATYLHHLTDNEKKGRLLPGINHQGYGQTSVMEGQTPICMRQSCFNRKCPAEYPNSYAVPAEFGIDEDIHNVNNMVENGMWNVDKMFEGLPEDLANHIVQNIRPPTESSQLDTPFWMLETRGHFTVKSAWDYLRRRANPKLAYKMIWVKGLPFKISFFLWKEESLVHLFFTSNAARSIWSYFLRRAGIALDGLSLHQAITKCWTAPIVPRLKPVLQALPAFIVWELWKRRNSLKYGEAMSVSKVIYQVSSTLQSLVQLKKPGLHVPHKGWIKVNTDGACRGTPGRSSIGFCIRDEAGDLIYAEGREISEGTNNESKAVTIVEALKMCKNLNYCRIWLQTDSMLLKNIIEESWKSPWYITEHVGEILILKEQSTIKVTHIFREGNTLADHLANYALDEGNTECHGFWDLDSKGRRIINEDKIQCISSKLKPNLIVESEMVVLMHCIQSTGRTLKMGFRTFTIYYTWKRLTSKGSNAIAWEIS
ncbi:uncharacterized protein LOC142170170 [Nicotiana tabacum]|uniref:Uncharacterized protein LOC142170170 n=1 Tax=Nicotiana tabacum TaxID=4097 RepID=A0AC58ST09_TOBAC